MNINPRKLTLLLLNTALIFFLILLSNLKIIPLRAGDFAFFTFLLFLFALYRPSWMFLFFIGTIPLENISLAPESLGIAVRPYQFLAALIIIALLTRFFLKKLNFQLPKWKWFDLLPILIVAGGFLSLINAPEPAASFKLVLILSSFATIYFLTRIYIQTIEDLRKIIPFFLSSSLIIVFYGIWQNVRFLANLSHFEAMPGRPNSTFTEPEWLGAFLIVILSSVFTMILHSFKNRASNSAAISNFQIPISNQFFWLRQIWQSQTILKTFFCFLLSSCFLLLVLTVSRSAWLGTFVAVLVFLALAFLSKILDFKSFVKFKLAVVISFFIGLGAVYLFHLTNFQLFNRAQSTASGLQKITIACDKEIALPESISNVSELAKYNCRHINLEEIEQEKASRKIIQEIYRADPNVNTRKIIYQKTWQEIKNHPILGIGWGSINQILGADERGTPLNASNVFLEIWLGSGIIGLLAFIVLLGYVFIQSAKNFLSAQNLDSKVFAMFVLSALTGLIIFNLFNSGILLAFLWVFLGISTIKKL